MKVEYVDVENALIKAQNMKLHTAIVSIPIQGQLSPSGASAKAEVIKHYSMTLKKYNPEIEKDLERAKI